MTCPLTARVPAMVGERRSALLVLASDEAAIADTPRTMMGISERSAAMARKGRGHFETRHDLDRLEPRLADILGGRV